VDSYITVTEEEISASMKLVIKYHHQIIEGSAGVAVAALIKEKERFKGKKVAIIICGGNVSEAVLKSLICN
jgi:threonine dehydratase